MANENPILELIIFEVEYRDGYVAIMTANVISENLFAHVDQEGNKFLLFNYIINTRTDGT